ncbi:MAG: DUF3096 domain-containing protein [Bacteroidales bacterium]|nr:DUF3096 domain-containing protein [Bacteroidales bacterium]MCF8327788.1 DUF3096 domain-containing protein [Bacteroidales bacterium]
MFGNRFLSTIGAPGSLITIVGISFIVLGILIMLFPELLAWLVGIFLIFDGIILLGLGGRTRRIEKQFNDYHNPKF